ncbi:threonine aldolase [Geosmithia morbida]|uniref:Threonine aldolase n=1 Tax=Geosmithia morbida TaxID=1094350 RepID=A0A9P4YTV2_9HYPO|nr:threonine aldolase [Geosmithia morbida]KAF4123008.1 threonine aldolase [Geosmithia morbida]
MQPLRIARLAGRTQTFWKPSLISSPLLQQHRASSSSPGPGNSWVGHKGPGGFDLRSDVMTTPTPSMLSAIRTCSMRDDVFQEDTTTSDLEAHVAGLAGKEAGLFVLSGTMGNQLALRSHLRQPPHGVLCDENSHIFHYEAGGVASLCGAMLQAVTPKNGMYLTLEDVAARAVLDNDVHSCPTRVISLENTLNGMVMPLSETRRISDFARARGIAMHCDGARLWEAVASGAGSLADYSSLFDTLSLCMSKGLGAPVGSVLVGPAKTISHSRWVRKSIGGGLRQPGLLTAAGRVAVDEAVHLLPLAHSLARDVESIWTSRGGRLIYPVQTNMCWLDLDAARCPPDHFVKLGERFGLALGPGRLVLNYQTAQNGEEVLSRLERVFDAVFDTASTSTSTGKPIKAACAVSCLTDDFAGVELDEHRGVGFQALDGNGKSKVIEDEELQLEMVEFGEG